MPPLTAAPPPRPLDPLAALLSYAVPGLGQIVQGRVAKGLLFVVCLHAVFFYGMAMGQWKNVWLPDVAHLPDIEIIPGTGRARAPGAPPGAGIVKTLAYRPQFLAQFWIGAAAWPALVQYRLTPAADGAEPPPTAPFGRYMQAPTEAELNALQRRGDKRWDLGWVYTVVAGVLNLLVIFDALAGPVRLDEDDAPQPEADAVPAGGAA